MRSLPEHPTTVFTKNCVSCYLPEVRSEMETVSNIVIMSKWEKNYSSFFLLCHLLVQLTDLSQFFPAL